MAERLRAGCSARFRTMPSDPATGGVSDIVDVALLVASALEAVGAEYFVGGSVASGATCSKC